MLDVDVYKIWIQFEKNVLDFFSRFCSAFPSPVCLFGKINETDIISQ